MRRRILVGIGAIAIVAVVVTWLIQPGRDAHTRSNTAQSTSGRLGTSMRRESAKPASLSGRVTRVSDGNAVAGAVVSIERSGIGLASDESSIVLTSDADGRWTAPDASPGDYAIAVAAPGFLPAVRETPAITPGEQRSHLDVALTAGGTILKGTISSDNRAPIVNARMSVHPDFGGPSFVALSGTDGTYEIGLVEGNHQIQVTHDDYQRTDLPYRQRHARP